MARNSRPSALRSTSKTALFFSEAVTQAQVAVAGTYLATNRSLPLRLVSKVLPKATAPVKLPVTNTLPLASVATARVWFVPLAWVRLPVVASAQAGA